MRIDKYLADQTGQSRSEIKEAIRKGKVFVEGKACKDPSLNIADNQEVILNGEVVRNKPYAFMLNKPAGYLCASKDDVDPVVLSFFPKSLQKDLLIVGRLDKNTTGLLLLTYDGKLVHDLTSPRKEVAKTYIASVTGILTKEELHRLENGVDIGDETITKPATVHVLSTGMHHLSTYEKSILPACLPEETEVSDVEITVTEGRFHQIKRMFHVTGHEVFALKRIREGNLVLPDDLALGAYLPLSKAEFESF